MKMFCSPIFILGVATLLLSPCTLGCNIFILAGQSNMSGRGGIAPNINGTFEWDRKIPPECRSSPQIMICCGRRLHEGISFADCITFNYLTVFGVGPFANTILQREPTMGPVGLVGNTNISQWRRGSCLYNRLLTRVRAAQLQGGLLLWYQGENDANILEANFYKSRLEQFFADVALASGGEPKYRDIIRDAQLNSNLPNVECEGIADRLHLQTQSHVCLGKMMADTYLDNFF